MFGGENDYEKKKRDKKNKIFISYTNIYKCKEQSQKSEKNPCLSKQKFPKTSTNKPSQRESD